MNHCATCRCDTSGICACGHTIVVHDLTKTGVRTACSVSTGKQATPCSCIRFEQRAVGDA